MFTGIIETIGSVSEIKKDGGNRIFTIQSDLAPELKVDQSVSHNGVCLTVTSLIAPDRYQVVTVPETLQRSNLGVVETGETLNLERAMKIGGRLDGHIVQGHVDQMAVCQAVNDLKGSWEFVFEFESKPQHPLIEKGSICVNGVSLTCYNITERTFQVSIIPYTFDHTNFKHLQSGDQVNLEFDIIGKYIMAISNLKSQSSDL